MRLPQPLLNVVSADYRSVPEGSAIPFSLSDDNWTAMLRGLVAGQYHLLLGAGASMTSANRAGEHLPSGAQMIQRLVDEFELPTDPTTVSLPRAYEAAQGRATKAGSTLLQYLEDAFTGCAPADWYEVVCTTRWRAIWTLNIDDVVENAYAATGGREQQAVSLSWTDGFVRQDNARNEVQILHLHGSAERLERDGADGLVFSIVEYLRASEHRHAWHHVFSDEFQSDPFIVVGASLADEVDLAEILRRGNHALELTGRPSLVVLRSMDELQRQEFEAWGLCPVEAEASAFFDRLAVDLREFETEFAATTPGDSNLLPGEAVRFLQQFRQLSADRRRTDDQHHDIYSGHEPLWDDILANRDAVFGITARITSFLRNLLSGSPGQVVSALTGPPFSGKTAVLLRSARELTRRGIDVFLFDGEQRVDVPATLWWLANSGPTVLMFDGLADQSPEIWDLARSCRAAAVGMTVFGTERTGRRSRLYSNLPPDVLRAAGLFEMWRLSDADIRKLVSKLRAARRLGRISELSRDEQERYFRVESGRDLLTGMAQLESGRGFVERLARQHGEIKDPALQNAYGIAAISHAFGYAIPIPVVCASAGVTTGAFLAACRPEGPLGEVLEIAGRKARPRHRRLASLLVEDVLTRQQRYDLSQVLARNLAPYVTRATIAQRTLHHRIVRELMNHRVLGDWLGAEHVDEWYGELADVFDWNARFWEQRALASARVNLFDKAESFAAHAVVVYRDSFTYTTLGTILLRKASAWADPGTESSLDYYWRGVDALREARRLGQGRVELPYLAFFTYTLALAEDAGAAIVADETIRSEWERWFADARLLPLFGHSELRDQLDDLQRRWFGLAIATRSAD